MLEELLAITNLVDFEDYGSLQLIRSEWAEEVLTLSLNVSADEYPEVHPRWQIISQMSARRVMPGVSLRGLRWVKENEAHLDRRKHSSTGAAHP